MYVTKKSPWIENHFYNSDDYERFREKLKKSRTDQDYQYHSFTDDDSQVNTWAGPIRPRIYGDGLQSLCDNTRNNLRRLQIQSLKNNIEPCQKFGISHMHAESRPTGDNNNDGTKYKQLPKTEVRWNDAGVMFTRGDSLENFGKIQNEETDRDNADEKKVIPNTFCYLCSTLEEHQRRHLHKTGPPKKKRKPKVVYIAPPPTLKEPEEPKEKQEVEALYKVVVWTGNRLHAGSDANVYIKIKGSDDVLQRTKLARGFGSVQFSFTAGSREIFYLKGPNLGYLESLTIEHDGLEKRHSWFLDKIEVTDVKADYTWVFICDQWLSLHAGDYRIKRNLVAKEKEASKIGYEIIVTTGKKKLAGTDAEVYCTIYGTQGRNSPKIHLKDKSRKCFERGSVDNFQIVLAPLGDLRKIRIEHDGTGFASGWFLEKVVIINLEDPKKQYYFIYGGWLAKDVGDGLLWREIKGIKKLPKEITSGRKVKYEIKVRTGDVKYAGTDANVTIQMLGDRGCTQKLLLDDEKNNFERAMTDNFTLQAHDVGPIYEIKIGHDNSGVGAGWFLDEVTIRKYIAKQEVLERLRKTKGKHVKKKEKLRVKRGEAGDQDKKKKDNLSSDSDSSALSDSEDEEKISERKQRLKSKRKKNRRDAEEDEYEELASRYKVPLYDEYHFTCKKWLAQDEDDGLYMRTLTTDNTKTYYED